MKIKFILDSSSGWRREFSEGPSWMFDSVPKVGEYFRYHDLDFEVNSVVYSIELPQREPMATVHLIIPRNVNCRDPEMIKKYAM